MGWPNKSIRPGLCSMNIRSGPAGKPRPLQLSFHLPPEPSPLGKDLRNFKWLAPLTPVSTPDLGPMQAPLRPPSTCSAGLSDSRFRTFFLCSLRRPSIFRMGGR